MGHKMGHKLLSSICTSCCCTLGSSWYVVSITAESICSIGGVGCHSTSVASFAAVESSCEVATDGLLIVSFLQAGASLMLLTPYWLLPFSFSF